MTMTAAQYNMAVTEAANDTTAEQYLSDVAFSSVWGDAPDVGVIPNDRLDALIQIWEAVHRTPRDIVAASGMSQRRYAQRHLIPVRTVEDWCRGICVTPLYVRLLLQRADGLLTVEVQ